MSCKEAIDKYLKDRFIETNNFDNLNLKCEIQAIYKNKNKTIEFNYIIKHLFGNYKDNILE